MPHNRVLYQKTSNQVNWVLLSKCCKMRCPGTKLQRAHISRLWDRGWWRCTTSSKTHGAFTYTVTRLLATTSKARWTRYLFYCYRAIYSCSICAKASRLSTCAAARCNCSRRCKSSMFSSAGVSALTASAWNFTCNNAKICLMVVSLKIS